MKCAVSHDLDEHLAKMEAEDAADAAREAELDAALADVPDQVADVIRHWIGITPEFCAAIDAELDKLITERNEP